MINLLTTKREKILFILIISILFFLSIFNFYLKPIFSEVKTLKKLIFLNEFKELNLLKSQNDEILFKSYEDINIKNAGSNEEKDYADFIVILEKIAEKVNIPISDMKKLPTDANEYIKLLSLRIEIEGTMEHLIKYIHELSDVNNNIGVSSVSFQKNQEAGTKIKLILELNKALLL